MREALIEAAARVILDSFRRDADSYVGGDPYSEAATVALDSILDALMEPSEEMLAEGWDNSPSDWTDHPNLYKDGQEALAYIFRAMLSTLRASKEEEDGR